jgi:hypothetical protein
MSCCHCKPKQRIQFRRDSAANWYTKNPVLCEGEFGYELDTGKAKIGDGRTKWQDLPYWSTGSSSTVDLHIVSTVEPPPGTEIGQIWIDPTPPPPAGFSDTSPIEYTSSVVQYQSSGEVIGISADGLQFHQPVITGAIPVKIQGVEHLIPIIDK